MATPGTGRHFGELGSAPTEPTLRKGQVGLHHSRRGALRQEQEGTTYQDPEAVQDATQEGSVWHTVGHYASGHVEHPQLVRSSNVARVLEALSPVHELLQGRCRLLPYPRSEERRGVQAQGSTLLRQEAEEEPSTRPTREVHHQGACRPYAATAEGVLGDEA